MKSAQTSVSVSRYAQDAAVSQPVKFLGVPLQWLAYAGAVALLLGVLAITQVLGYSLGALVRDPNVVLDGDPLIGIQSNIGVLAWFASAVCCFLYSVCFAKLFNQIVRSRFFFWSGVVTLVLVLDDFFMIHEYAPVISPVVSQPLVYLVYGLMVLAYGVYFRKLLRASAGKELAAAALVFLGLSLCSDLVQETIEIPFRLFFEDGFKLLGIVSWSSFFIRCGFDWLRRELQPQAR